MRSGVVFRGSLTRLGSLFRVPGIASILGMAMFGNAGEFVTG